jgi:hypothetical protein
LESLLVSFPNKKSGKGFTSFKLSESSLDAFEMACSVETALAVSLVIGKDG